MNPVIDAILTRYSCRKFTDEPLKREDVEVILKCAAHAPSGRNRQSFQFTALTAKKDILVLIEAMKNALNLPEYTMYDPSCIILVSNDPENHLSRDDNACALENIFLAAHSLGIGSVWINQLKDCCHDEEVRKLLTSWSIPENHTVTGIAALGYPAGDISSKERKAVINIIE